MGSACLKHPDVRILVTSLGVYLSPSNANAGAKTFIGPLTDYSLGNQS